MTRAQSPCPAMRGEFEAELIGEEKIRKMQSREQACTHAGSRIGV